MTQVVGLITDNDETAYREEVRYLTVWCKDNCLLWQLLGLQLQGTTEGSVYGPVHHRGQASCHSGPLYQAVSEEGPKNGKDSSHHSHGLFSLLPRGKRYLSAKSRSKRLLNSFYPQAIRLLNT